MDNIPISLPTRIQIPESAANDTLPIMNLESSPPFKQLDHVILRHQSPSAPSSSRLQNLLHSLPKVVILKPLDSFTLFSELPKELRDLVWKQVAFKGRLIPLHEYSKSVEPHPDRQPPFLSIPSMLLVSHHVRREGLRYYQKVTERSFHLPISVPRSQINASTSQSEASSDSEDSEASNRTELSWRGLRRAHNDSKIPMRRTVYLNFKRDIFSIDNIPPHLTAYFDLNFESEAASKIQRLSIITTPVCGEQLINERIPLHLFKDNSLRVVRVYIEHAWQCTWRCRHGTRILDLLVPDSNWIRWEQHIKTMIVKNREDFQDAGLTSGFTFYWKYQEDRSRSSRLAAWKIQRKPKQVEQGPELIPETE